MTITRSAERQQFLGDIITTAVEGGTGYWAQVSQYQYVDTLATDPEARVAVFIGERTGDGTRAVLHEINDDETGYKPEELLLDEGAVARGLGRIKRMEVRIAAGLFDTIKLADAENDAGNIDADGADVIVQAALLGEVRYG